MKARTGLVLALAAGCGGRAQGTRAAPSTCAALEVQHGGVTLADEAIARGARVPCAGVVTTDGAGRAVIRTDEGLELRVAGDTRVRFADGVATLERGRVFATGQGADARAFQVGDARLEIADAALELERDAGGLRAIVVRGEVAWRQGRRQGQLAQGEALEGSGELSPRAASVWDDWTGGAASPQGIARPRARGVGAAFAHVTDGEAPVALAVRAHEVQASIRGDLAVTTVEQRFFNGASTVSPVDWRLPLPEGALVARFRVGRANLPWTESSPAVLSRVAPDGAASALYADDDGTVHAFLGLLAPGDELRVSVTWTQWLTRDGGRRTFVAGTAESDPPLIGEYSLDVDLGRAGARAVAIPEGARLVDGHVRLRRSDYRPRGELAVELTDAPTSAPTARAWQATHDGVTSLALDLSLPTAAPDGTDVIVVLDDSAGTERSALEMARAAVDATLRQLGASDRVALWFGDLRGRPAEGSAGALARLDDARREAIVDAVARVRLGGATNLGRILADANAALDPSRNGVVLYLGDATPTVGPIDPSRLRDDLRRQAPDLRLYVLGLGSDAHPEVLAPLAAGAHATERATDRAEAVAASGRLVARALQPMLRDVVLTAGPAVHTVLPARVERWFAGEPLRFVGVVESKLPKEVRVRARVAGDVREWTLPIRPQPVYDEGDLRRRWAQLRVRDLIAQGGSRGAVADLGARFGLVTPVSGLSLDGVPTGGVFVHAGLWDESVASSALPSLGVAEAVLPRGIDRFGQARAAPIAVDDGSGWAPHALGEGQGLGGRAALVAALSTAGDAANACVARKRALRPSLAGEVTVRATVAADGRVSEAVVAGSTLRDAETEACVQRAVSSVTLPPLELLGAAPDTVERTFRFDALADAGGRGPAAGRCPSSAQLPRPLRTALWRERWRTRGGEASGAVAVWTEARSRCELRWWEDRVALLEVFLDGLHDPASLSTLREGLADPSVVDWFDAALARRFGPAFAWRAAHARGELVDWDALLRRLSSPTLTPAQRVEVLRAWLVVAPRDIDLLLRYMDALAAVGRAPDARAVADRLRRDPAADARVRSRVGELLLRLDARDEALRAFSEIVEGAPYDPSARERLGDLLLAYDWFEEAYAQYVTLRALRPGDPAVEVRVALAALGAGREDEALRTLRAASEGSGDPALAVGLRAMLDREVLRLAESRRDDPGLRAWTRGARAEGRDTVVLRWAHPDVGLELFSRAPDDAGYGEAGESPLALGLRVYQPLTAVEGLHLVVRGRVGLRPGRPVRAALLLRLAAGDRPRAVQVDVSLDATHRARGYVVRNGALVEEPVDPTLVPTLVEALD